jgi:hypothetical protein
MDVHVPSHAGPMTLLLERRSPGGDNSMEWSLKPRHVNEMRRVLDAFLADHGIPDELLVRSRREKEELTREAFTLALLGREELVLSFAQKTIVSLQFTRKRSGSPIEFVRVEGEDAQTSSRSLNTIFTTIVNDNLPSLDKVMRILLEEKGSLAGRSRQHLPGFLQTFPHFQVPSPTFYRECYGGGRNRDLTELFVRWASRGHIEHKRFKVICQWGNTLRIDLIEIRQPKEGSACFIAVNGIITVWQRDHETN